MAKQRVEVEIDVTSLNVKGDGRGKFERFNVEIPMTVPGDRVQVELGRHHRGWYRALPQEIISPSDDRVEPRCKHAGQCGGCRLQQMAYPAQLKYKQGVVGDLFKEPVEPIVGCESPWAYRNKMEFSFSQNRDGDRFLGLMIVEGRGRVADLTECHLVNGWFAELLQRVRDWWATTDLKAYKPHKDEGSLRNLTVREGHRTGEKLVMLTVREVPTDEQLASFVESVGDVTTIILQIVHQQKGVPTWYDQRVLEGPGVIHEELMGVRFRISPTAFFQPNTGQAERVYQTALEFLGEADLVYDLYCGTGTLGLLAAARAKKVVGIEINEEAVADAGINIEINGIDNLTIHAGDVGEVLSQLDERPDAVLVDPPRPGLTPKALEQLVKLQAPTIVYVSCNPVTQARDIAFCKQNGYRVDGIQPIDQFPHTPHVENVVKLILLT